MQCAHCDQPMALRDWFQLRLDGGYHCASCHQVFYVEDYVVQSRVPWVMTGVLVLAGVVAFEFAAQEIIGAWFWIAFVIFFTILCILSFAFALRNAPSVPALPAWMLQRRQLVNIGTLAFALGITCTLIARGFISPETSRTLQTTGSIVFIAFLFLSRLKRPPRPSTPLDQ